MSDATVSRLRLAVAAPGVVERYRSHIRTGRDDQCWLWTGAISGKGHGRFQVADQRLTRADGTRIRRTYVVIAHRFGYATLHGVDALLNVPLLAHRCDNPLCQNPQHWRESNHRANGEEYAHRRDVVRGALADTRGARGRAHAVREAARAGATIGEAVLAGLRPVHRDQIELFTTAGEVRVFGQVELAQGSDVGKTNRGDGFTVVAAVDVQHQGATQGMGFPAARRHPVDQDSDVV